MRQSHKTDALEHVTAGAGSASLSATTPVVPLAAAAGVSSAHFFLGAGAFLTQVHGGTRRRASPFCLPSFSMLRQALQNGASGAPTPSLRPRSSPQRRRPKVCLETMEFDF